MASPRRCGPTRSIFMITVVDQQSPWFIPSSTRSCPTMAPTQALTRTRVANWTQLARSPSCIGAWALKPIIAGRLASAGLAEVDAPNALEVRKGRRWVLADEVHKLGFRAEL